MYAKLNKMYQKGQAVITPKGIGRIININRRGSITLHELLNEDILSWYFAEDISPATEAEILTEAGKNGWKLDQHGNYQHNTNSVWFFFHPTLKNYVINSDPYEVEDYSIFGQECIIAHRLITALNQTK